MRSHVSAERPAEQPCWAEHDMRAEGREQCCGGVQNLGHEWQPITAVLEECGHRVPTGVYIYSFTRNLNAYPYAGTINFEVCIGIVEMMAPHGVSMHAHMLEA